MTRIRSRDVEIEDSGYVGGDGAEILGSEFGIRGGRGDGDDQVGVLVIACCVGTG